ncbi:VTT domain-containing protein, partial [Candidatus Curtissbacteria bacterium]|nr:VTT domain-containing protein [Candidatus Curtissbacteria bacterium]
LVIIALATLGSFLGDNFDYFLGRHGGRLLEEKPLYKKSVTKVEPFLEKYGILAIFAGRFSGWSRAWIALASGIIKFRWWKFALVSLLSAFSWTGAWVIGGYLLGANRDLIEDYLGRASVVAWLVFLAILIYYFRTRIRLILELIAYTSKKHGARIKDKIWR